MGSGTAEQVVAAARAILDQHWRADLGYCAPNARVYPWQWLWDSCFHTVCFAALGDPRGRTELASALAAQRPSGFVPHMGYQADPSAAVELWGVLGRSTITQPPMFGHALRRLVTAGFPAEGLGPAVAAGLRYFFRRRLVPSGLVAIWHPWESGMDDSPRWRRWQPAPFDARAWAATKQDLLAALETADGEPVGSSRFAVASASFNALVAFNALEAAAVLDDPEIASAGRTLADRIDELLWDEGLGTWVDRDPTGAVTSTVRTLDGLLPVLVTGDADRRRRVLDAVVAPDGYGLRFGPAGVHPAEPDYEPTRYWAGGTWPQLTYLLWWAARQAGLAGHADRLAELLVAGACRSGFAEYWHPETGEGLGARPQTWSALTAVVCRLDPTAVDGWSDPASPGAGT